ncbi:MAG: hypothetical protein HY398_00860 [Candidatus Doudnabacteria bacterium]|nr:hypothetical protein [Candidatus Doudnabacteria bacterium]
MAVAIIPDASPDMVKQILGGGVRSVVVPDFTVDPASPKVEIFRNGGGGDTTPDGIEASFLFDYTRSCKDD